MIRLRPGALADAQSIAEVQVATWRDTYAGVLPTDMLVNMSVARHTTYWQAALLRRRAGECITVALVDDTIVGYGSAGPARGRFPVATGDVQTLYVLHDFQELGLGRALLRALFASLVRDGMRRAVIWVVAQNHSRFFYEAMGGVGRTTRTEQLWKTNVATIGYEWDDLDAAIHALDARMARTGR
ncbi:MAG: GNAT family N-acetyltransferase [Alphaproteobacteria bacterium]|nr:GNAT family N-acetyltransferase [Alphaproteobacteria bacterium]